MKKIDLTGKSFSRLTVITQAKNNPSKHLKWLCRCECGNETVVDGSKLKNGHTRSCGCLARETKTSLTHGKSKTAEHAIWRGIISRCTNPNVKHFHRYGGRGITMCEEWRNNFDSFIADMGPRPDQTHSIDRIDNNGHYSCGHCTECKQNGWNANCRWATRKEQNTNRQDNLVYTHNGQTMCLKAWAEHVGIKYGTLYSRVVLSNWPFALALSLEPDSTNRIK